MRREAVGARQNQDSNENKDLARTSLPKVLTLLAACYAISPTPTKAEAAPISKICPVSGQVARTFEDVLDKLESAQRYSDPERYRSIQDFSNSLTKDVKSKLPSYLDWQLTRKTPESFEELRTWLRRLHLIKILVGNTSNELNLRSDHLVTAYLANSYTFQSNYSVRQVAFESRRIYQIYELCTPEGRAQIIAALGRLENNIKKQSATEIKTYLAQALEEAKGLLSSWNLAHYSALQQAIASPPTGTKYGRFFSSLSAKLASSPDFTQHGDKLEWCYKERCENKVRYWRIEVQVPRSDLYPGFAILRDIEKPDCFRNLRLEDFVRIFDANDLGKLIKETKDAYASEQDTVRWVDFNLWDVPENDEVVHLRYAPDAFDPTIAGALGDSMIFSTALGSYYQGRFRAANLSFPTKLIQTLEADLTREEKVDSQKPKTFVLDLYCHGSTSGLAFNSLVTAGEIAAVLRKHPNSRFLIFTMACHGGNLRDGFMQVFKSDPELGKRVTVVTEAKPDSLNFLGLHAGGGPELLTDDERRLGSLFR